ncbi:hypothetical protein ACLKMH_01585 [Psychromonas sp. KJ10-10]|uniref:hypothetical protein n=1 Tax=Psychromonas sp. KJ10-10 TaxID=3391823 RepID=UPI0039B4B4D7
MAESAFLQSLIISQGNLSIFIERPISLVLTIIMLIPITINLVLTFKKMTKKERSLSKRFASG